MRALDEDTQLMICSRLDLKSLGRLRRVSHHFNERISRSKALWLSILDREILSRGLPLHQGRIHIESATAEQIESWVKCALILQKAYSTGASSEVSRVNLELCVTWLKVVRARWCIVAASNTEQSRLSLIDLAGDLRICKEMQLPGPVLSGAFEDQHNWLSLALTIGATKPFVLMISIGHTKGDIIMTPVAKVQDLAYAVTILGGRILCAVNNGDDTYPYVVNWQGERIWKLVPRFYIENSQKPLGLIHCLALTAVEWLDFVVVITDRTIEVFCKDDFDCSDVKLGSVTVTAISSFQCTESFRDRESLVHAVFEATGTESSLSFIARRKDCRLLIGSLYRSDCDHSLSLEKDVFVFEEDIDGHTLYALRLVVGNGFGTAVLVQDGKRAVCRQPRLSVLRLSWAGTCNSSITKTSPRMIEFQSRMGNRGQPMLHYLSGLDFDDAAGLLVIGTSRGDVCLTRFLPTGSWARGSLRQELPELQLSHVEISGEMYIPEYYRHLQEIHAGTWPLSVKFNAIEGWTPRYDKGDLSSNWSTSWMDYKILDEWISPTPPRWPVTDLWKGPDVDLAINELYQRLGTKGTIIPVAYGKSPLGERPMDDTTVFRVGLRMYVALVGGVEDIGYDRIFIYPLALRFDETFDGNTLRGHCHVHTGQSLDWDGDCGSYGLASWMWRAKGGFSILDAVAVSGTNPEAETLLAKIGMDPEAWAAGDWNLVLKWNNSLLEASLQ